MQHFPIFLNTRNRRIVLSGGGEAALAKLRLLMKSEALLIVCAPDPAPEIEAWAEAGRIALRRRALRREDLQDAVLIYAADEDATRDARTADLAKASGVLLNVVDNLDDSQFITPAIVDRDPVTIAIGTEGAAPVLARGIKARLEDMLSPTLGALTRAAKAFRPRAEALPAGQPRRAFWSDVFFGAGANTADAPETLLPDLLAQHLSRKTSTGHVTFVGAGPGDPELLTLKARKALDRADVVIHDRLIGPGILELARREAILIDAGKQGFGPAMTQDQINALIVEHVRTGADVVRLKGGDATVFGRLDEEIDAVVAAGQSWSVVPGITSASAAVAALGQSLTKRGRNTSVRLMTAHDVQGFADHDWQRLATPGEVAAIYMGKRAARFLQGRLLMHGADPETPVSVVENASLPDQRILPLTLGTLEPGLSAVDVDGPALLMFGLTPRAGAQALPQLPDIKEAL